MILPNEFTARMQKLLGEEYKAFLDSYEAPAVRALRVNTLKTTAEDIENRLGFAAKPLSFCENGFTFTEQRIGADAAHHAGMFYAQDPSAMAVLAGADLRFDHPVRALDLCAAPGGKTSQLAALLPRGSFLVANEIVASRARILQGNLERMGVKNTLVLNSDSERLAKLYPAFFDVIVVDAPCSGEGMFRKYPEAIEEWTPESPAVCAARQKEILQNAIKMLAPGGHLLYSTCTFAPEENEEIVLYLLENYPELRLVPVSEQVQRITSAGILAGTENARRFYPHKSPGEGQFMAHFENTDAKQEGSAQAFKSEARMPTKEEEKIVLGFWNENLTVSAPFFRIWNDLVFASESEYAVPKGQVFSPGVPVGNLQKGRLVPHHGLFSTYGGDFVRKISLTKEDTRMKTYLSGNSIPCPETQNGWAAVLYYDAPCGGAKVVSGMAKNHYPKGLRLKFT